MSISKDPLTAEEMTQETFFKALKKIDEFRGESSIKVWLCQIAKNTYYDYVKRQGRHEELPDEYGEPQGSVEQEFFIKSDAKAMQMDIRMLDHIIVAGESAQMMSFKQDGLTPQLERDNGWER